MTNIEAIIVEDQELGMKNLVYKIQENCPNIDIVAQCQSGKQALQSIKQHAPQLVFMDYDLGNMTGFQVLDRLEEIDFEVIFVTNFDEYAIEAINRYSPTFYLVKPIDDDQLVKGVKKASKALQERLISNGFLKLPSTGKISRIPIVDILYLEASNVSTLIYTKDGRFFIYTKPLKYVTGLLSTNPNTFCRMHKSYTVNLQYVHTLIKEDGMYHCIVPHPQNPKGKKLPVGETFRATVLKKI